MRYRTQLPDGGGIYLTKAMAAAKMRQTEPPEGWTKHTHYHWSRQLKGKRLDFWPSKDKWMYEGQIMCGDVDSFIAYHEQPRPAQGKEG